MSIILTFPNHKGGCAKSSSCLSLAAFFALRGYKILLVDTDPQANLSFALKTNSEANNLYEAMKGSQIEPINIGKNLDIIPGSLDLAGLEIEMLNEMSREYILKDTLRPYLESYDLIMIDPPPSLGLLTINGLACANIAIIPTQQEILSLKGLTRLKGVIGKVQARLNRNLVFGGVFQVMYDSRRSLAKKAEEMLEEEFANNLYKTKIRINVAVPDSQAQGVTIFKYDPNCNAAKDYTALAKEIKNKFNF